MLHCSWLEHTYVLLYVGKTALAIRIHFGCWATARNNQCWIAEDGPLYSASNSTYLTAFRDIGGQWHLWGVGEHGQVKSQS